MNHSETPAGDPTGHAPDATAAPPPALPGLPAVDPDEDNVEFAVAQCTGCGDMSPPIHMVKIKGRYATHPAIWHEAHREARGAGHDRYYEFTICRRIVTWHATDTTLWDAGATRRTDRTDQP